MTRSSTQSRRSNGDQLLLLATLRRLLRRLLRLRLSLLRHCCPPSHDEWRCRNSAVANRRALHSDYTSTTEKTLTPLNGTCTKQPNPPNRLARRHATPIKRISACTHCIDDARMIFDSLKIQMASAFSRHACLQIGSRCMHAHQYAANPANARPVSLLPCAKKIFHRGPKSALRGCSIDQKRANRTSVIRVRACEAPLQADRLALSIACA